MTTDSARHWIDRLQHVSLPVPGDADSLAVAREFYGTTLGLEEIARPTVFPGAGIWYAIGDAELHLFSEPSGVAANPESKRHPCFEIDDQCLGSAHARSAHASGHDGSV